MPSETEIRTLREMINRNDACRQRFDEAERLAKGLFDRADCVPLPYYTPHEASHCEAIEKYLNQIIWGGSGDSPYDFVPTPEEAMYLLSAVWLHDIGMLYGVFHGERPEDLARDTSRIHAVRNEHEMRTVRYIQNEWHLECRWSNQARTWLSNICAFHRRHHPIGEFEPVEMISELDGRPIRLVVLAALLRLADACHEDQSRAPGQLMELYRSLGMPGEAAMHWEKAKLIVQVDFDHTNRKVVLTGCCPKKRRYDLCEFDLGEIIDIVCQDMEGELQSIQPVLLRYPNIYFGRVITNICRPILALDEDRQHLALWPYLLDKPTGSTETATALAHMLLIAVKGSAATTNAQEAYGQDVLLSIMDKTQELRPGDFMVRSLCRNVRVRLADVASQRATADDLAQYLEDVLTEIGETCRMIAEFGPSVIGRDDVLVVHGYCRSIAKFLEALRPKYNNTIYIVEYQDPVNRVRLGPSQNARMRAVAHDVGFQDVRFVPLSALPHALSDLRRRRTGCKVLLGTRGVLKRKEMFCKVGSYVLASVAKQYGAQVIAFAEGPKFGVGAEREPDVAALETLLFPAGMYRRHPDWPNTTCLITEIEVVPKKYVDLVLTETGLFKPNGVLIPAEERASNPAAEKKGSSPA